MDSMFNSLNGKRIVLLGFAFKKDTGSVPMGVLWAVVVLVSGCRGGCRGLLQGAQTTRCQKRGGGGDRELTNNLGRWRVVCFFATWGRPFPVHRLPPSRLTDRFFFPF